MLDQVIDKDLYVYFLIVEKIQPGLNVYERAQAYERSFFRRAPSEIRVPLITHFKVSHSSGCAVISCICSTKNCEIVHLTTLQVSSSFKRVSFKRSVGCNASQMSTS